LPKKTWCRYDIGEHRFANRDGARLVEQDGVDFMHGLERFTRFDEHTEFCCFARAYHDGGGRGESEGAGACDGEHRHKHRQRKRDAVPRDDPSKGGN